MKDFDLNSISVKSPCTVPWETMTGDERTRFCKLCKLNVFNLSGMNRAEAEEIIRNKEGRLCVRYVKRADGTVLTKDSSPIRVARLSRAAVFAVASIMLLCIQALTWAERRRAAMKSDHSNSNPKHSHFTTLRLQDSRLYSSSGTARTAVDWAEAQVAPTPYPQREFWGLFE